MFDQQTADVLSENTRLRAENERLRAALKPFADTHGPFGTATAQALRPVQAAEPQGEAMYTRPSDCEHCRRDTPFGGPHCHMIETEKP